MREAQLDSTKILPNVGMAVITDVGMEHNIHPTKKKPVGERLALAARGIAYHEPIEYSGPRLQGDEDGSSQIDPDVRPCGGRLGGATTAI